MSNLHRVKLELDDQFEGDQANSIVDLAIADGAEDEKCVVTQYRTSKQQKQTFAQLVRQSPREAIPIEWVIDIADESNGWFYATAYHYDDVNQMLHVMVPDKVNPTFDGSVQLDHRTVHLIECVDGKSMALFNKIVRDSVIKIKWDVEWFEEAEGGQGSSNANGTVEGSWITSSARYFIRIANQLLVEDKDVGQETRGFVIITADMNVKLLRCIKGKGSEDFQRLLTEGIVQSSPEAHESVSSPQGLGIPYSKGSGNSPGAPDDASFSAGSVSGSTKKLVDTAKQLKESFVDLMAERDRKKAKEVDIATKFHSFALSGDLDEGLHLLNHFNRVKGRATGTYAKKDESEAAEEEEEERMNSIASDANYTIQKLEKSLTKFVKSGGAGGGGDADEVDTLKRMIKKMKRDMDDKDKEIRHLRGTR